MEQELKERILLLKKEKLIETIETLRENYLDISILEDFMGACILDAYKSDLPGIYHWSYRSLTRKSLYFRGIPPGFTYRFAPIPTGELKRFFDVAKSQKTIERYDRYYVKWGSETALNRVLIADVVNSRWVLKGIESPVK